MTSRRKSLLVVLPILLLLPLASGGAIGTVEVRIWLVLLTGWLAAFLFWGGRGRTRST